MRISINQVSSVVLRPKKLEIRNIVKNVKEPKKTKNCATKFNQIRRRIIEDLERVLMWYGIYEMSISRALARKYLNRQRIS